MAETRGQGPELSRDLGVYSVFTTATGTMIGAGIFILPGIAAEGAGPGAALSFLFAGIIASLAALSVCELATAMPKAGGPYYFVSRAMGPTLGTIVGLGSWVALVFKGAFALVGLGQYVLYFMQSDVLLIAVLAGVALTAINLVGAKASGILQNIVVMVLLVILAVFLSRGATIVEPALLRPTLPHGWSGVFTTTGVVFISYLGVVKAAAVSEEVKDPGRALPLGILSSVALVTVLYVATMVVVNGVLPFDELVASRTPLADAGKVAFGVLGGVFIGVAGLLATLSTSNAAVLSASRYPFAMARDGLMTPWISEVHARFKTPSRAILVTGGAMILLVITLDVESLAKIGGVFGMMIFSLVNVAVIFLRRSAPAWYRPDFRVPLYPLLPAVGALAALAPIALLDLTSQLAIVAFVVVGVVWFRVYRWRADRGGAKIEPDFGFFDKVAQLRQVHALETKRRVLRGQTDEAERGVVVVTELTEDAPNAHLLGISAAIARRHLAPVDALLLSIVPAQSPLDELVETPDLPWVRDEETRMRPWGVPLRLHHVLARDRGKAILGFAQIETRAIVVHWPDDFRWIGMAPAHIDRVLRDAPARAVILKARGDGTYRRILVATAGSPYTTAEVETANAIADLLGAQLTLLMVLPPDASGGREEEALGYLEALGDLTTADTALRIVRGDDVTEAILEEAADHDLVVLGATRQGGLLRRVFGRNLIGRIAHEVAERAEASVLVTKDPTPSERLGATLGRVVERLTPKPAVPRDDAT